MTRLQCHAGKEGKEIPVEVPGLFVRRSESCHRDSLREEEKRHPEERQARCGAGSIGQNLCQQDLSVTI